MTNRPIEIDHAGQALALRADGERFLPGQMHGVIELEHLHRYALARELAAGKAVLDIASGEGYGSHLLAGVAASVIGVDIDADAVAHAGQKYQRANLAYRQGDCTAIPLPDQSIDMAVSFETIEHHDKHAQMLSELKRVLKPGGLLMISTPDKANFAGTLASKNEFHVKELSFSEFETLLAGQFSHRSFQGQAVLYGSLAMPLDADARPAFQSYRGNTSQVERVGGIEKPIYYIALASDAPLPVLPASLLDGTAEQAAAEKQMVARLTHLETELARTSYALDKIHRSAFWRATLPLRLVRNLAKRVF